MSLPTVRSALGWAPNAFNESVDNHVLDRMANFNLGAGAMRFFNAHVGLRGDVRYVRTSNNNDSSLDNVNFDLDNFDCWRASVGVVLR